MASCEDCCGPGGCGPGAKDNHVLRLPQQVWGAAQHRHRRVPLLQDAQPRASLTASKGWARHGGSRAATGAAKGGLRERGVDRESGALSEAPG